MLWIAGGLLAFAAFLVLANTWNGRWNMSYWRVPGGGGVTYGDQIRAFAMARDLPLAGSAASVTQLAWSTQRLVVDDASGFFVFSNRIVFFLFTTFLMPLWTLSFATEGLGREREAGNLVWVLSRPLSRPAIYLAKFLAAVPWCLALNMGGFALLCVLAGWPGILALAIYWPAVLMGTLALASLFHFLGAFARRASVVAILYAFFLETIAGNLPGHLKRLSISFYTRCLMFEQAHEFGIQPERPSIYLPVSGSFAVTVLATVSIVLLVAGAWIFARKEYLELT